MWVLKGVSDFRATVAGFYFLLNKISHQSAIDAWQRNQFLTVVFPFFSSFLTVILQHTEKHDRLFYFILFLSWTGMIIIEIKLYMGIVINENLCFVI